MFKSYGYVYLNIVMMQCPIDFHCKREFSKFLQTSRKSQT